MKFHPLLEDHRVRIGAYSSAPFSPYGAFELQGPCGRKLVIIASDGNDPNPKLRFWEHVSVSTARAIPNWIEMDYVKRLFWDDEECAVQFHPPRSRWVNNMANVLHLWRWTGGEFPMPPTILVGDIEAGELKTVEEAKRSRERIERQVNE